MRAAVLVLIAVSMAISTDIASLALEELHRTVSDQQLSHVLCPQGERGKPGLPFYNPERTSDAKALRAQAKNDPRVWDCDLVSTVHAVVNAIVKGAIPINSTFPQGMVGPPFARNLHKLRKNKELCGNVAELALAVHSKLHNVADLATCPPAMRGMMGPKSDVIDRSLGTAIFWFDIEENIANGKAASFTL